MNNEIVQLDEIYKQLVYLHDETIDDKMIEYAIRKILENYETYLRQLHGENWMPSDLF